MKRFMIPALLVIALFFELNAFPAFPGAEGYGKNSLGGRGGDVIWVTNLNNSGAGSLREAVKASGPRIVVFRVAGIIELESPFTIENPYLTIAGQTAPGDGICIKFNPNASLDRAFKIKTHDVVIRYIRIRCGFAKGRMDWGAPFDIHFGNGSTIENIILDHCSSSWHPGRTAMTIWPQEGVIVRNITIQRYIASEALLAGDYPAGARGAFLFGSSGSSIKDGETGRITLYKSLTAHNRKRQPEMKTCQIDSSHYIATYQVINNVIYNFFKDGSLLKGNEGNTEPSYHFPDEEVCHYNILGNYYKRSEIPDSDHTEISLTPGVRVYVGDNEYGNIGPSRTSNSQDPWDIVSFVNYNYPDAKMQMRHAPTDPYQVLSPFDPASLPPYETALAAYTDVLDDVGANMGLNADGSFRDERDDVDIRIINDVLNNTGEQINTPEDVGGWPSYSSGAGPYADMDADGMSDVWEEARFATLDRTGKNDFDSDGYTDLEEFLNGTDPKSSVVLESNAGVDQTVANTDRSGSETITLDGSGSSGDNAITSWVWTENGTQVATGETATADFAVGTHIVTLTVADADGNTGTDQVVITVTETGPAGEKLSIASVSTSGSDGTLPLGTIDGDLGTHWSSEGDGEWIQFELAQPTVVTLLRIAWHKGNTRVAVFDILVSDDSTNWAPLSLGTSSSGSTLSLEDYDVINTPAHYVRIVGHGNNLNEWNSITEVEIYGLGSSGIDLKNASITGKTVFLSISPNPLQPPAEIAFHLARSAQVDLSVYGAQGKRVIKCLVQGSLKAGVHRVQWRAVDQAGRQIPNGVYLMKLKAGDYEATKSAVLLR